MERQEPTTQSRRFAFLLLPGFSNLCLANAVEPLRAVNSITGHDHYRHLLVSVDGEPVQTSSGIRIGVDGRLRDLPPVDAFFVIAGSRYRRLADDRSLRRDIHRAGRAAGIAGGLDTGPWLLAAAELLDGHRATIHWQELEHMQQSFPAVEVTGTRYVIDRRRITAGGATAVLDLMLSLIREQVGEIVALDVMRLFLYDRERAAEGEQLASPHAPFTARNPIVAAAIERMTHTIERPLPIAEIARLVNCSQRGLERAFADALEVTPQRYYQYLRLSTARRMLQEGNDSVADVATATGFASASAFARAYRQLFGQAPRSARARLPRQPAQP